ncbi:hypothetical protein R1A27_08240 [Methylobacterium sp. NMS12]|uniref:hypothetical protein n=1 Tax=Methylobacterium sp. NMS12 TaxID=3079766 RepID=UPI003F883094
MNSSGPGFVPPPRVYRDARHDQSRGTGIPIDAAGRIRIDRQMMIQQPRWITVNRGHACHRKDRVV